MKDNNDIYDGEWAKKDLRNKPWVEDFCKVIIEKFNPASIIDFGCGSGDILAPFEARGIEVLGLDASKAIKNHLKIDKSNFLLYDLRKVYQCSRKYDLVFSLEVGEHIEKEFNDIFVKNLYARAPTIIFTAASGKRSRYHPNPQPKDYWIKKFLVHSFFLDETMTLRLKKEFKKIEAIQPWYINNLMVFQKKDCLLSRTKPNSLLKGLKKMVIFKRLRS